MAWATIVLVLYKRLDAPHREPRYFVFPGPASLPAVTMALNRAGSGDDFVVAYLQDFIKKRSSDQDRKE